MHKKYMRHYYDYLGIIEEELSNGNRVYVSKQREIPTNHKYYYEIICTLIDGKVVFSVAPSLSTQFLRYFEGKNIVTLKDAYLLMNEFANREMENTEIRYFTRMGLFKQHDFIHDKKVKVLTEEIFERRIASLSVENQQIARANNTNEIKGKRKFEIKDKDQVASMAKVSDICFNGGNLVVYTHEEYRQKGYGKALINSCILWCQEKKLLPIYLVVSSNKPSISLAASLGLEKFSEEVILSRKNNLNITQSANTTSEQRSTSE